MRSQELPAVAEVVEGRVKSVAVVAVQRETVYVLVSDLCTPISTRLRFEVQSYHHVSLSLASHILNTLRFSLFLQLLSILLANALALRMGCEKADIVYLSPSFLGRSRSVRPS